MYNLELLFYSVIQESSSDINAFSNPPWNDLVLSERGETTKGTGRFKTQQQTPMLCYFTCHDNYALILFWAACWVKSSFFLIYGHFFYSGKVKREFKLKPPPLSRVVLVIVVVSQQVFEFMLSLVSIFFWACPGRQFGSCCLVFRAITDLEQVSTPF